MKQYIVNGANGYIASNFINSLLRNGHRVIALVRAEDDYKARDRMVNALEACYNGKPSNIDKLTVYAYGLGEENLGLNVDAIATIFALQNDYYHFAACLKFSEKTKSEIFETNIDGLENSIAFYKKHSQRTDRFFFISSAYSCGHIDTVFEEKFYDNADLAQFRNYYELSKRLAENIVKKHIEDDQMNAYILRPSQVVGDMASGITKTDFGVFGFIKRVARIAHRLPNQTIRVHVNNDASQNLIPIDVISQYLYAIATTNKLPRVINLVSEHNTINSDIREVINETLPIHIDFDTTLKKSEMTHLEKIVEVGMTFTGSYTNSHVQFCTQRLDTIKPKDTPSINKESLRAMIEYFVNAEG